MKRTEEACTNRQPTPPHLRLLLSLSLWPSVAPLHLSEQTSLAQGQPRTNIGPTKVAQFGCGGGEAEAGGLIGSPRKSSGVNGGQGGGGVVTRWNRVTPRPRGYTSHTLIYVKVARLFQNVNNVGVCGSWRLPRLDGHVCRGCCGI